MTQEDKCRRAFEEWWKNNFDAPFEWHPVAGYLLQEPHTHYRAFKAAWKARGGQPQLVVVTPDYERKYSELLKILVKVAKAEKMDDVTACFAQVPQALSDKIARGEIDGK